MTRVHIAGAVRTPIGKFGGSLAGWTAADLGVAVVKEALTRSRVAPDRIAETIFGCGRQAGGGPNVARQVSVRSGIPESAPAYTVNQACASGLRSVILGTQELLLGRASAVVVGGTESMSRVPYYVEGGRWGARLGNQTLTDGMYQDGFMCPLAKQIMGETAETLATEYSIGREEQDEYAAESQRRAVAAESAGRFAAERISLELAGRNGATVVFDNDEHVRADADAAAMAKLRPVFSKTGTVTAGNASGITDGASAMVLLTDEALDEAGAESLGRVVDYEISGVDPARMGIGPVPATRRLLERRGLTLADIDVVELNEAFAAQVLACDRELGFDRERLNPNGGSIALGHPIGCTGSRILTTLVYELARRDGRYGLATLCVSGGMGVTLLVER
ncbi:MAG: thiolase family protein [Acidobacteria bacterium]|nr:thiolase family protein [Acidobacteriota bacterium]